MVRLTFVHREGDSVWRRQFASLTDGSAIRNPGPGGWAAVLIRGSKSWEMSGASPWTTISEMELLAAVLRRCVRCRPGRWLNSARTPNCEFMECASVFSVGRGRHVKQPRGMELQHQQLWKELLRLNERLNIRWRWIRGHSGHPVQARADALAYRAAQYSNGATCEWPHVLCRAVLRPCGGPTKPQETTQ